MASRQEIEKWFDRGVKQGATHLIVVCDTFDHDDYPVFVDPNSDVQAVHDKYHGKHLQQVMEIYNLSMPKDSQMNEFRAWNV